MSRITFRKLALLLAAVTALLVVVGSSTASAGEYPEPECAVIIEPDPPYSVGQDISISGEGWPAGATVNVKVNGTTIDTVTADGDGAWGPVSHEIANEGNLNVTGDGCVGAEDEVAGVTVVAGAAAAAPLPATGSSSTEPLVRTAVVLIAAGGVLVYAVRRRSQAASS